MSSDSDFHTHFMLPAPCSFPGGHSILKKSRRYLLIKKLYLSRTPLTAFPPGYSFPLRSSNDWASEHHANIAHPDA